MHLGIDLGTSSVKAVLIDGDGRFAGAATAPLAVSRPHPGWSEQDPADWIAVVEAAIGDLRQSHAAAFAAVRGIGLSGQMHGATVLGADDRPLRPAILWNDGRAAAEAAALDADPRFRAVTGNVVFPGFTAPKLAWMARHEPDLFAAARTVLLPKDYLRLVLTGIKVSDLSDASGTAWLDVGGREWSDDLLAATGLDRTVMPALAEGTQPTGTLRPEIAARWSLQPGVVVAGGAGDNAAAACGIGAVAPGAAFVSLGTSGVLFAVTDRFRPNPASAVHTFCHALPDTWHQMGVILAASASLEWLAGLLGRSAPALTEALGAELSAPAPVRFLPYLSGERTPHNDAAIRGAFVGLDAGSTTGDLTRAVLEGVAYALRDSLDALEEAGTRLAAVTAVGGGARSHYWLQVLATVLGVPVAIPADGEYGAAMGAARLGLIAASGAEPRAVCTPPPVAATIDPEPSLVPAYRDAHRAWRSLYPAIKGATA